MPRDLDAVTLKALAKAPAERYQSVSELDADLARWLNGRPVAAVPPRPWYVFSRWVRRHQVAAATAALAVVGIMAALGIAFVQYRQAEGARAIAEERFTQVRRLANSLIFQLDDVVRTKSTTEARQRIVADALQYLDRLAASSSDPTLRLELAQGYLRVAEIQGGPNVANLGNPEGARESARKALAILEPFERDTVGALEREAALEALVGANRLLSTLVPKTEGIGYASAAVGAATQRLAVNRSDEARVAVASAQFSLAALLEPVEMRQHYEAAGREFEALLAEQPPRSRAHAQRRPGRQEPGRAAGRCRGACRSAPARRTRRRAGCAACGAQSGRPASPSRRRHLVCPARQPTRGRARTTRAVRDEHAPARAGGARRPSNRFSSLLFRRSLAQVARTRLHAGDAAGAREAALRFLDMFAHDTSGPTAATERHWRGWAYLVAATTDGQLGRHAQGCARLALALDDFQASVSSVRPMPKADLAVARAALPGCAAVADAAAGAAK